MSRGSKGTKVKAGKGFTTFVEIRNPHKISVVSSGKGSPKPPEDKKDQQSGIREVFYES